MNTQDQTDAHSSTTSAVALGVTGSIGAYKAADLTSRLTQSGVDVHVVMTENATKLVQPQTFLTLSRNPVTTDLWHIPEWNPEHIALAERTDMLMVAPATANFLGKLAAGIADDALSTLALSHEGPVMVAPAMNPAMWAHPAVQENVETLQRRGVQFVGPAEGITACGTKGIGRMEEPDHILKAIRTQLAGLRLRQAQQKHPFQRIVVTAGPTREFLDPVRFLSNRSSGKMGYAVAAVAAAAGHEVTLISGPVSLPPPAGVECRDVQSASEMRSALKEELGQADILVMTAAVSDYTPTHTSDTKVHRENKHQLNIEFEPTPDILAEAAASKRDNQFIVGFAAETEPTQQRAREKLQQKNADMLVVNDVNQPDAGFEGDNNEGTVYLKDGSTKHIQNCDKTRFAEQLLAMISPQSL